MRYCPSGIVFCTHSNNPAHGLSGITLVWTCKRLQAKSEKKMRYLVTAHAQPTLPGLRVLAEKNVDHKKHLLHYSILPEVITSLFMGPW